MKKNISIILSLLCTFILTNEVNALTFNQTYKYQQLATTSNLPGMDHINGYRFAGSGAGVNNDVPCGMALYITSCYEDNGVDYCYYSNYNISDSQGISYGENHRREGVVYRDKLKEKVEAADATCDEDTSTAEYGWRYASNAGIIDTTFACLDKLYITSCRNNICNFSKILTKDYQEIKKSGSVNRDYLSEGRGIEETCLTKDEVEDNNTEEEKINCSNEPIKNLKGTQTFSVCYNNKYSDEDIKNLLSENNMVGCGKRYVDDETATLNYSQTMEFVPSLENVEELDNTNCAILNDYPTEQLQVLVKSLVQRVQELINQKAQAVGITLNINVQGNADTTNSSENSADNNTQE